MICAFDRDVHAKHQEEGSRFKSLQLNERKKMSEFIVDVFFFLRRKRHRIQLIYQIQIIVTEMRTTTSASTCLKSSALIASLFNDFQAS